MLIVFSVNILTAFFGGMDSSVRSVLDSLTGFLYSFVYSMDEFAEHSYN